MGRLIIKVPPGFEHPRDEAGDLIPGAHWDMLEPLPPGQCVSYQVYEDTSPGTPLSPVLSTKADTIEWIMREWSVSREEAEAFFEHGRAPSFVSSGGQINPGVSVTPDPNGEGTKRIGCGAVLLAAFTCCVSSWCLFA